MFAKRLKKLNEGVGRELETDKEDGGVFESEKAYAA